MAREAVVAQRLPPGLLSGRQGNKAGGVESTRPARAGLATLTLLSEHDRTLILVEGDSDRVALETLAARTGRDLAARGARIVSIGGAHAIRRYLEQLVARDGDVRVAGLCDAGQEGYFRRALEIAGLGAGLDRPGMARLGFFVCVEDLEDELIRALGPPAVERVIEAQGETRSFRSFQRQPAQLAVSPERQLHRFMGTHAGRKAQYARALVEALELEHVPEPLRQVLDAAGTPLRP